MEFEFRYPFKSEILDFRIKYPQDYPNSPLELTYLQKLPRIVIDGVISPNGHVTFNWSPKFNLKDILKGLTFEIAKWMKNLDYTNIPDSEIDRYYLQAHNNEEIHKIIQSFYIKSKITDLKECSLLFQNANQKMIPRIENFHHIPDFTSMFLRGLDERKSWIDGALKKIERLKKQTPKIVYEDFDTKVVTATGNLPFRFLARGKEIRLYMVFPLYFPEFPVQIFCGSENLQNCPQISHTDGLLIWNYDRFSGCEHLHILVNGIKRFFNKYLGKNIPNS